MSKQGVPINPTVLRIAFQMSGLNQSELAEAVGVSRMTIQNWIWGHCKPMPYHLEKLSEVLGLESEIFGLPSLSLVERSRTLRVCRFYLRELLGMNDPPSYAEVQSITKDLERHAELHDLDEVKPGQLTVNIEPQKGEQSHGKSSERSSETKSA